MHPTADQILEREEARLGHLRYCEQQFDGCSPEAMQTLSIMHDLLNAGSHHLEMEKAIVEAQSVWPLSAAGVWPNGTPLGWHYDCATRAAEAGYTSAEQIDWWLGMFGCARNDACAPCAARDSLLAVKS